MALALKLRFATEPDEVRENWPLLIKTVKSVRSSRMMQVPGFVSVMHPDAGITTRVVVCRLRRPDALSAVHVAQQRFVATISSLQ